MPICTYRELNAWTKSFELVLAIYQETASFPVEERYGITSQLRRAVVSIPSNIAEGEGRKSAKEFRHFLFIALGSLMEAETQILIAKSLGFLSVNQADKLMLLAAEAGRLINGLTRSLLLRTGNRSLTTDH
jgi:four helix bundle protein